MLWGRRSCKSSFAGPGPVLAEKRKEEAHGKPIITYCAGCANYLGGITPAYHLLDLIFEPEATLAGKANVSQAPITYWNRIRLKSRLNKILQPAISRERSFNHGS